MQEVISRLQDLETQLKNSATIIWGLSTPPPGCIHGGDNPNRICGLCELQFDVRPLPARRQKTHLTRLGHALSGIEQQFGVTMLYEAAG